MPKDSLDNTELNYKLLAQRRPMMHCIETENVQLGTVWEVQIWRGRWLGGRYGQCCCQDLFLGLETETWVFRSRDRDLDKMNSSLETMVSRSQDWLHQFQLVIEHSLKGATNYGNRATGVGTKHAVLRPRPSETLDFRSWDRNLSLQVLRQRPRPWRSRDRDLDKMNSSLETMVSRSQHRIWFIICGCPQHGTIAVTEFLGVNYHSRTLMLFSLHYLWYCKCDSQ